MVGFHMGLPLSEPVKPRLFERNIEEFPRLFQIHNEPLTGLVRLQCFRQFFQNTVSFLGGPGVVAQFVCPLGNFKGGTADLPSVSDGLPCVAAGDFFAEVVF